LHRAAEAGHLDVVRLLFESQKIEFVITKSLSQRCVDVGELLCGPDASRMNPLHYVAQNGHADVVRYLCAYKRIDVNAAYRVYGSRRTTMTPLHLAACNRHVDVVRALCDCERVSVNAEHCGRTALHFAAEKGHVDVVRVMCEYARVDVNAVSGREASICMTPLHLAACRGYVDVVQALCECERVNVNITDAFDRTPLNLAALNGFVHIVECLTTSRAGRIDFVLRFSDRTTALHCAASSGHVDVVRFLLDRELIDVNATNRRGDTPLHLVVPWGRADVVRCLLARERIDVNATNCDGDTPLHAAVRRCGRVDSIELLLADRRVDVNVRNNAGMTPLHVAVEKVSGDHSHEHDFLAIARCLYADQRVAADVRNEAQRMTSAQLAMTSTESGAQGVQRWLCDRLSLEHTLNAFMFGLILRDAFALTFR